MLAMSGASASSAVRPRLSRQVSALPAVLRIAAFPATIVVAIAVAVLLLLSPFFIHPALDLAGSGAWLGVSAEAARAYSDRTVGELLFGPQTFAFSGPDGRPFYGADEVGHLHDVRFVLFTLLGLAAVSVGVLLVAAWQGRRDAALWRSVSAAGATLAVVTLALGALAAVAFSFAFELFHRLLFPGGNWAFDPGSQRLVQLYPLAFWQLAAGALAVLLLAGGMATWWLARRRARGLARGTDA